jgi:hypothetical protein
MMDRPSLADGDLPNGPIPGAGLPEPQPLGRTAPFIVASTIAANFSA